MLNSRLSPIYRTFFASSQRSFVSNSQSIRVVNAFAKTLSNKYDRPTRTKLATTAASLLKSYRSFATISPANIKPEDKVEVVEVELPRKDVAIWLFIVAALVFAMVVLGGLTRLTKSGLSMVHWSFTGEKRPSTEEEWEAEFARYKDSPEYKIHNQGMSLEEFKFIYYMEYGHRTLGRIIGLAFGGGLAYFLARGRIPLRSKLAKTMTVLLGLGGFQGLIGWWMVRSGLDPTTNVNKAHVSPYRLATHLISAFILYVMLMTTGLRCYHGRTRHFLNGIRIGATSSKGLKKAAHLSAGLAMLTAFSGAFVAGNEAGLIYNEFPLMGGRIIPSDIINPYIQPAWKNMFENSTMVQFTHRCLAMSTTVAILATWWLSRGKAVGASSPTIRRAANYLLLAVGLQVTLGITTLLSHVPVSLAAGHQAGALALLTAATNMMFVLMNPGVAGTVAVGTGGAALASSLLGLTVVKANTDIYDNPVAETQTHSS